MKRKMMTIITATALIASICTVAWAASGPTEPRTPTVVWSGFTSGNVYVSGLNNKAGCNSSTIAFTEANSDPEKIQALATAAFLSGKRLKCVVDGCHGTFQKGKDCKLQN